jgi:predicted DsbA family dithiol-disulfide isomerase
MRIDAYHDIVCPWCRIGKRHLDLALERWDGPPPEVRWRPFLLNPEAPQPSVPLAEYFRAVKGVPDARPVFERVERVGAAVGLRFDFDRALSARTEDAHRLLLLTPPDRRPALLDGLHRAYFEEGADLSDRATLADIAAAAGGDRSAVLAALDRGDGLVELQGELRQAHAIVQGGVPFFVFDDRYALSGAQPPETILETMRAAAAARVAC